MGAVLDPTDTRAAWEMLPESGPVDVFVSVDQFGIYVGQRRRTKGDRGRSVLVGRFDRSIAVEDFHDECEFVARQV